MLWVNDIVIKVVFYNYGLSLENPKLMGKINLGVLKCLKHRLWINGLIALEVLNNFKSSMGFHEK